MQDNNIFDSKEQVLQLIERADDNTETLNLIKKFGDLKKIRTPFYLTLEDFEQILTWKLRGQFYRQSEKRKGNTNNNIQIITHAAFEVKHEDFKTETKLKLKILSCLIGVEIPVASAILTLCFPDFYAVIDYRNWRQIYPERKPQTSYTYNNYLEYLTVIMEYAVKYEISTQKIDMALWQLDKVSNSK